jgi:TPR repeat protein
LIQKKYAFFDPITGKPRVWYWRSDKGDYEFYDNPGFHPRTGESLLVVTKEIIAQLKTDSEVRQKQLEEERLQREKERRERTEREDREKRALAEAQQREREKRDAERQLESQAATLCDQLAGNPTDPRRSGDGTSYAMLKVQAKEAVVNCEIAVRQSPNELRFQYQLGRALQFVDRQKAFAIQRKLVELRYPAAFDNLGWLFYTDQKNITEAVSHFRRGAQLGNPDCMVSLAEMIDRGLAIPTSQGETKIELYGRAAALGGTSVAGRERKGN